MTAWPSPGVALMFANPQAVTIPLALPSALAAGAREAYVLTPAADGTPNPLLQSKKVRPVKDQRQCVARVACVCHTLSKETSGIIRQE